MKMDNMGLWEGNVGSDIPGEDIIRDSRNAVLIPQLQTQRQHQRRLP